MKDELELLEYTTILQKIADATHTTAARQRALALRPLHDLNRIRLRAKQIADAAAMLEQSSPPLTSLAGLEDTLPRLELGDILPPKAPSSPPAAECSCICSA